MKQQIMCFKQDEERDWYVELSCGHTRHMRHNPPWFNRPWVEDAQKREGYLGTELDCIECDQEMNKKNDIF